MKVQNIKDIPNVENMKSPEASSEPTTSTSIEQTHDHDEPVEYPWGEGARNRIEEPARTFQD